MFSKKIINEAYECLLEYHEVLEANYIMTNCLAILGDKKIVVQNNLDNESIARINQYKYPERLASFVKTSSKHSIEWSGLSFARIACS